MLDAEDTKSGLAGAVFEVRDTSGRLFDTVTTGAKNEQPQRTKKRNELGR